MGHSVGDGLIVTALAALTFGYLFLKYRTRIRRLELVHQERLTAMEKDFPLPEIPLDPPRVRTPPDPRLPLILGTILCLFGVGCMIALRLTTELGFSKLWVMPLPIVLMGIGIVLVYFLASNGEWKRNAEVKRLG